MQLQLAHSDWHPLFYKGSVLFQPYDRFIRRSTNIVRGSMEVLTLSPAHPRRIHARINTPIDVAVGSLVLYNRRILEIIPLTQDLTTFHRPSLISGYAL